MKKLLLFFLICLLLLPASVQGAAPGAESTWSKNALGASDWLEEITYGNGTYIAVGRSGLIMVSKDVLGNGRTPASEMI